MSFNQANYVWMSGKLVPWSEANVHVSAHSLHLGSGIFEALRCYETESGPAIFRLDAHLERLWQSASVYEMAIPFTKGQLEDAICETISSNGLSDCYIRILCYYGSGSLGVFPRQCPVEVTILAWTLGTYIGSDALKRGAAVTISSWVKFHSQMMPTTAKASGQYLNSLLALREALDRGCDEALLLDLHGNIAEGSGENLFIVRDGILKTNDDRSSILMGITRDAVIRIAGDLGYEVEVGELSLEELLASDEAFFTGTAAEVTPIREVDGKSLGRSVPGPITAQLQEFYFAAISGKDSRYKDWLRFLDRSQAGYSHSHRV
ncbi:MAG: branched-chain amino acid transaminase [Blastocatellia bacterium]|nr:branched-chain amino acid transaminase [Blastocatellia bacterium]